MSLDSYKIQDSDIAAKGVISAPNKLTGTAQENKAVFDKLIREAVKGLYNSLIDALVGTGGAGEIGVTAITGVTGGDIQTVLGSLKTLLDTKAGDTATTAALALKSDKSVTNLHFKAVSLDSDTGVFTFTREDGTTVTIDTVLEKVATNWTYDADTQSLVLTLADGSTVSVPLSAFITETEFDDSSTITFTVTNHVVTAAIKSGSITDDMLDSDLITTLQGLVGAAADSATAAHQDEEAAKGYKQNASDSAGAAANSQTAAAASATLAQSYAEGGTNTRTGEDTDNAKYYKEQAAGSASSAAGSATAADGSAEDAEAWAVGQRDGTDVGDTDPTYHNNARYWAEIAEQAAGGGVTSFNGRTGVVVPQDGDYTKDMVGLGNVPNVTTNDQEPTYEAAANLTALSTGEKLSVAFGKIAKAISSLITHLADTNNPHSVTAAQAGAVAKDANSSVAFTMGVDAGGLYMVTPDE